MSWQGTPGVGSNESLQGGGARDQGGVSVAYEIVYVCMCMCLYMVLSLMCGCVGRGGQIPALNGDRYVLALFA